MTQITPTSPARKALIAIGPFVVALVMVCLVRSLVLQPFTIPSSSMSPQLLTGDYILVSKFPYGWSWASLPLGRPQGSERLLGRPVNRGEVVVFRLPRDTRQVWIKRVIGLPGDRVEMRSGRVILNGRRLAETAFGPQYDADNGARLVHAQLEQMTPSQGPAKTYVTYDGGSGQPGDDTPAITVPPGHYLVMGDNRDNSVDGRWPAEIGVGLLPASHLVGRAEVIAWSWKPGASLFKPWTWLSLRLDRFGQGLT